LSGSLADVLSERRHGASEEEKEAGKKGQEDRTRKARLLAREMTGLANRVEHAVEKGLRFGNFTEE
jgi:hypothetical protein